MILSADNLSYFMHSSIHPTIWYIEVPYIKVIFSLHKFMLLMSLPPVIQFDTSSNLATSFSALESVDYIVSRTITIKQLVRS